MLFCFDKDKMERLMIIAGRAVGWLAWLIHNAIYHLIGYEAMILGVLILLFWHSVMIHWDGSLHCLPWPSVTVIVDIWKWMFPWFRNTWTPDPEPWYHTVVSLYILFLLPNKSSRRWWHFGQPGSYRGSVRGIYVVFRWEISVFTCGRREYRGPWRRRTHPGRRP